jgi:hypothetical protein
VVPSASARMPTITKTRKRIVSRSRGAWTASLGADALTMVIGLAICANFKFIGTIPGSEVVLIPVLPILLIVRFRKIGQRKLKYLFVLLGLWLVGQIVTDIYRGTAFFEWARSDSAIVFTALDLAGLAALVSGSERRKGIFMLSFALGSLLQTRISPSDFFADMPWKWGYGPPVTSLVVLVSCWFFGRRQYTVVALLLLGIAGANLFADFRSPVLMLLVTIGMIIPVIPERIGRLRILPRQGTVLRLAVLILIVIATGGVAKLVVTGLAASGALGEEAKQKNALQENSTLGILLGGRPEIFISLRAVLDSPILGHGSYPVDIKYTEMYHDLLIEVGMHEDMYDEQNQGDISTIPAHSHLMQAWVFAGVFGGVFWAFALVLVTRGIIQATILRPALLPIYCFLGISMVWNVMFSPFGSFERIAEAFLLVTFCDLLNSATAPSRNSDSGVRRRRFFARPVRRTAWPNRRSLGNWESVDKQPSITYQLT